MSRCDGINGEAGYVLSCWAEGSSGGATPRSLPSGAGTSLCIFGRAARSRAAVATCAAFDVCVGLLLDREQRAFAPAPYLVEVHHFAICR